MKTTENNFFKDYPSALINTLDKIMEFYVILNAAKLMNNDVVKSIREIRDGTKTYLMSCGIDELELIEFNVTDEALDIFQVNYSYNRELSNSALKSGDPKKIASHREISKIIYEINSGNTVIEKDDKLCIKENSIEEQSVTKNLFRHLKNEYPCLHLIRMVDIANAPKLEHLIPVIHDAISSNNALNKNDATKNEEVKRKAIDDMLKLVEFYPERLYIGLQYIFPQNDDSGPIDNLALSFNHQALASDMQNALDDVAFQFEKFKSYYHNHDASFTDDIRFERLKPFMYKRVTNNKYIKQFNSIEGTFYAMLAWEKHHDMNNDKDITENQAEIINGIYESLIKSDRFITTEADFKRKIRDRLKEVSMYIDEQHSVLKSISNDYHFQINHKLLDL